jgi:hypothetical protein
MPGTVTVGGTRVRRPDFMKIEKSDFHVFSVPVGLLIILGIVYRALLDVSPETTWIAFVGGGVWASFYAVYGWLFFTTPRQLELVGGDTLVATYFGGREKKLEIQTLMREKKERFLERTFEYVALRDREGRCRVRVWTMMKGWKEFVAAVCRDEVS